MQIYKGRIIYEIISDGAAQSIDCSESAVSYLTNAFNGYPMQEQFFTIALDRKNYPLGRFSIALGLVHSVQVHAREVFRPAIMAGASAVIVSHNHPSGDPTPSNEDKKITRFLLNASDILDIPLMDHIIVGNPESDPCGIGYYSFADNHLIELSTLSP